MSADDEVGVGGEAGYGAVPGGDGGDGGVELCPELPGEAGPVTRAAPHPPVNEIPPCGADLPAPLEAGRVQTEEHLLQRLVLVPSAPVTTYTWIK